MYPWNLHALSNELALESKVSGGRSGALQLPAVGHRRVPRLAKSPRGAVRSVELLARHVDPGQHGMHTGLLWAWALPMPPSIMRPRRTAELQTATAASHQKRTCGGISPSSWP